jgi:hypothetical protein
MMGHAALVHGQPHRSCFDCQAPTFRLQLGVHSVEFSPFYGVEKGVSCKKHASSTV